MYFSLFLEDGSGRKLFHLYWILVLWRRRRSGLLRTHYDGRSPGRSSADKLG